MEDELNRSQANQFLNSLPPLSHMTPNHNFPQAISQGLNIPVGPQEGSSVFNQHSFTTFPQQLCVEAPHRISPGFPQEYQPNFPIEMPFNLPGGFSSGYPEGYSNQGQFNEFLRKQKQFNEFLKKEDQFNKFLEKEVQFNEYLKNKNSFEILPNINKNYDYILEELKPKDFKRILKLISTFKSFEEFKNGFMDFKSIDEKKYPDFINQEGSLYTLEPGTKIICIPKGRSYNKAISFRIGQLGAGIVPQLLTSTDHPLKWTKPCCHKMNGFCQNESRCNFAHNWHQLVCGQFKLNSSPTCFKAEQIEKSCIDFSKINNFDMRLKSISDSKSSTILEGARDNHIVDREKRRLEELNDDLDDISRNLKKSKK